MGYPPRRICAVEAAHVLRRIPHQADVVSYVSGVSRAETEAELVHMIPAKPVAPSVEAEVNGDVDEASGCGRYGV